MGNARDCLADSRAGANNGTTNAFGGNNLFGQNQNQPQQQPNTGGGLFGQQPQANPSPFGTFGEPISSWRVGGDISCAL
jgi:hypothetical protein